MCLFTDDNMSGCVDTGSWSLIWENDIKASARSATDFCWALRREAALLGPRTARNHTSTF